MFFLFQCPCGSSASPEGPLKEKLAIDVHYERIMGSRMTRALSILFAASLLGVARPCTIAAASASAGQSASQFDKEIQPLFEARCYECHGPQKQKSGLRLDRKSNAFQGGDSGKPAVVPGKSAESVLIQRITSKDPDEVMPPKGEKLTADQIEQLKKWIDGGAIWTEQENKPKHWAYIAPVRAPLPKVKNAKWCRNGIDFCDGKVGEGKSETFAAGRPGDFDPPGEPRSDRPAANAG